MDCLEKYREDYGREGKSIDDIITTCCPSDFNIMPKPIWCWNESNRNHSDCSTCWQRQIVEEEKDIPEETNKPRILDSGDRTEFESGAVRDMREGKGRCDLLPLDVVAAYICEYNDDTDHVLWALKEFQNTGCTSYLYSALNSFEERHWDNCYTLCLEVAIHFEEGAKKYGDNNWRKGIPVRCYIDSAIRHYLKWVRGDKDEPHDRAFCWNIMCAIWTCIHKPELNEYSKEE